MKLLELFNFIDEPDFLTEEAKCGIYNALSKFRPDLADAMAKVPGNKRNASIGFLQDNGLWDDEAREIYKTIQAAIAQTRTTFGHESREETEARREKARQTWTDTLPKLMCHVAKMIKASRTDEFNGGFRTRTDEQGGVQEGEWFRMGRYTWDVAKALRWIQNNQMEADTEDMPITEYAEKILALDKNKPWDKQAMSFFAGINHKYAAGINPKTREGLRQYNKPGLLLLNSPEFEGTALLIDGNHRMAARYMNGEEAMKVVVIDGAKYSEALQDDMVQDPEDIMTEGILDALPPGARKLATGLAMMAAISGAQGHESDVEHPSTHPTINRAAVYSERLSTMADIISAENPDRYGQWISNLYDVYQNDPNSFKRMFGTEYETFLGKARSSSPQEMGAYMKAMAQSQ
jgi:hypothetical protein